MHKFFTVTTLLTLVCCGCAKPVAPVKSTAEADLKLEKLLHDDYQIENILITQVKTTKIIAAAIETPIFAVKATKRTPGSTTRKDSYTVNYLNTAFDNGTFVVEYDISPARKYDTPSPGYASAYSPEFQQLQQNLLSAVNRAYGDLDGQDAASTAPEFIQLYITDIKTGIRSSTLMHYPDLKGAFAMPPSIPQDEYVKRSISEISGGQDYIGDFAGLSIPQDAVTWSDFLARQVKTRINFMFQYSNFPPEGNLEDVLLKTAAETLTAYPFSDYSSVVLKNTATGGTVRIAKDDLPPAGKNEIKIHHIQFLKD